MRLNEEIVRSLFAAWRIARFDANAMSYFNLSLEGFWRSFTAALIVLPFILLMSTVQFGESDATAALQASPSTEEGSSLLGGLIFETIKFVCIWAAWPLLMIPVSRFFGLSANYVPYIIAANWGAVLQAALLLTAQFILFSQIFPSQFASLLFIMAYVTALYYSYLIARAGLQCDVLTGIGLVVLNTVVEIGLGIGFGGLA